MPSTRVTALGQPITARGVAQSTVSAAKLKADGTQSVPNSVWTKITSWTGAAFDPLGMQTPGNPSRLTIKQPGRYMFVVEARWSIAPGPDNLALYKNAVVPTGPAADGTFLQATGVQIIGAGQSATLVSFDDCAAGDFYEVFAFVSGAATLRADASFSAFYIGPGFMSSGAPAGTVLQYKEAPLTAVALTATSGSAPNDILVGDPISFDGATTVRVEFNAPFGGSGGAGGVTYVELWDNATRLGTGSAFYGGAGTIQTPAWVLRRLTPAAGSHTFKARGWSTGSASIGGDSTYSPMFLRITKEIAA